MINLHDDEDNLHQNKTCTMNLTELAGSAAIATPLPHLCIAANFDYQLELDKSPQHVSR